LRERNAYEQLGKNCGSELARDDDGTFNITGSDKTAIANSSLPQGDVTTKTKHHPRHHATEPHQYAAAPDQAPTPFAAPASNAWAGCAVP